MTDRGYTDKPQTPRIHSEMAEELGLSYREDVIRIKEHQENCKGGSLLTAESPGSFLFRGTRAVCVGLPDSGQG